MRGGSRRVSFWRGTPTTGRFSNRQGGAYEAWVANQRKKAARKKRQAKGEK
jgi:hypothetical protein